VQVEYSQSDEDDDELSWSSPPSTCACADAAGGSVAELDGSVAELGGSVAELDEAEMAHG